MARADNAYSRLVGWLKILLPLMALAVMASIFVFSREIDPTLSLPYSEVELADRAREPRLTDSVFTGVTGDGARIEIVSEDLRPDPADRNRGSARGMTGLMETPDGATTRLTADEGKVDMTAQTFEMAGDVTIVNSAGYTTRAPRMTGSMTGTALEATGGTVTDAPMGQITSETFHIRADPANPGRYLLVFNDRVRLIYEPDR
jgi:lipopolysaccharide export system protein LptC